MHNPKVNSSLSACGLGMHKLCDHTRLVCCFEHFSSALILEEVLTRFVFPRRRYKRVLQQPMRRTSWHSGKKRRMGWRATHGRYHGHDGEERTWSAYWHYVTFKISGLQFESLVISLHHILTTFDAEQERMFSFYSTGLISHEFCAP